MQKKYIISCIYMLLCSTLIAAESLTSPDGNLKLLFSLSKQGEPVYELFYKSKVVIKPSKLGIEIKNDKGLMNDFSLMDTKRTTFDETWTPVWGEENQCATRPHRCCRRNIRTTTTDASPAEPPTA